MEVEKDSELFVCSMQRRSARFCLKSLLDSLFSNIFPGFFLFLECMLGGDE